MSNKKEKQLKKALAFEAKRVEERPVFNERENRIENLKKAWYKFSRNKLSVLHLFCRQFQRLFLTPLVNVSFF